MTGEESVDGLGDPEGGQDGEGEGGPVHESRRALMVVDTKERPSDGDASGEITLGGGEGVCGRGGLEEEEGEEHEDLGEDAGVVVEGVDAERVEACDEDQEGGESVPDREGEVDPELIVDVLGGVMFLDDVVDVGDGGADEEGEDEGDDVSSVAPDVDVAGVEEDEQGEAPVDGIDDDLLAAVEELVDHGSEEEQVDQGPDTKGPRGWGEVGLLAVPIVVGRAGDAVRVAPHEANVQEDIDEFEEDAFLPVRGGHG